MKAQHKSAFSPVFSGATESGSLPNLSYRVRGRLDHLPSIVRELGEMCVKITLGAGRYFCPASPETFYFVKEGKLRLKYIEKSGFERPLLVYEPGSIINLCSAIQGSVPLWTYDCLEDCILWEGAAGMLRKPENAARFPHLWHAALASCSSLILTYAGALTFLGNSAFITRFCRYLLLNVKRYDSCTFSTGLTQD